jgi:hypothetical protein
MRYAHRGYAIVVCRIMLSGHRVNLWWERTDMALEALFGFAGVVLGSITTSVLTIYRERLVNQREIVIREQQYERDRKGARDAVTRILPSLY